MRTVVRRRRLQRSGREQRITAPTLQEYLGAAVRLCSMSWRGVQDSAGTAPLDQVGRRQGSKVGDVEG